MRGSGSTRAMSLLCAAFVLLVAAPSTYGRPPAWWEVGGYYGEETYAVDLPKGWMLAAGSPFLLITRDGLVLQKISLIRWHVNDPVPNTRKKFRQSMLPQEAAEVFLDSSASDPDLENFVALENRPATVDGLPGFRALYSYRNKDRLKYKTLCYGFIREKTIYLIAYSAPARHYFDRDLGVFENIVQTFRFIGREKEVSLEGAESFMGGTPQP